MGEKKRFGCCLWQLIKFFLMLLLLGGMGYWFYNSYFCVNDGIVDYYKEPVAPEDMWVAESHYDYSELAKDITTGCEDDYQKIRAIYQWICDNIDYDTSYRIHRADSCFDAKKGVCQAYCELFYYMAKAVGVRTELISGKSKDHTGKIGTEGHVWLFAYTTDHRGVLLDPTWGVGSIDGKKFIRNKNYWAWFNVDPEWMILSHFPNDESYQLIDDPMTMDEFVNIMPVNSLWVEYGLNVHQIYRRVRKQILTMPLFYKGGEGLIEIVDIPMCDCLKVGESYTFRLKMKVDKEFALVQQNEFTAKRDWTDEGGGVYSIDFVPKRVGTLSISIKADSDDWWNTIVQYNVDDPDLSDVDRMKESSLLDFLKVDKIEAFLADTWEQVEFETKKFVGEIKELMN